MHVRGEAIYIHRYSQYVYPRSSTGCVSSVSPGRNSIGPIQHATFREAVSCHKSRHVSTSFRPSPDGVGPLFQGSNMFQVSSIQYTYFIWFHHISGRWPNYPSNFVKMNEVLKKPLARKSWSSFHCQTRSYPNWYGDLIQVRHWVVWLCQNLFELVVPSG